jgi:hypothetical protein
MAITVSEQEATAWIAELLRATVQEAPDGQYEFKSRRGAEEDRWLLSRVRLSAVLTQLASLTARHDTVLFDGSTYESLVRDESRFGVSPIRRSGVFELEDADAGITYRLSPPSDAFLLFLLSRASATASIRLLRGPLFSSRVMQRDLFGDDGRQDAFSAIRAYLPRVYTVSIRSAKAKSVNDLARHANAMLFQLTYNLDAPVVETRYLDDLLRTGRIVRNRRAKPDELEPPRRVYTADLVYHYQMGVATDNPLLEYLSYYHVAEHFFEEVFNDDLVEGIRDRITQPGFSHRRKKDVQDLIKEVSRRLRIRGESTSFSEPEALRLTLAKFVDIPTLATRVREYDPQLIDYYAQEQVVFSNGDTVALTTAATEPIIAALARRIYKTRNAIVHSKEGDRTRYIPFQHDKLLVKELPLLRFIAEDIIIRTSTVLS